MYSNGIWFESNPPTNHVNISSPWLGDAQWGLAGSSHQHGITANDYDFDAWTSTAGGFHSYVDFSMHRGSLFWLLLCRTTNSSTQRDRRNREDYKELAIAIVDVITIVQDQLQAVEFNAKSRFWMLCLEFNQYVEFRSKGLNFMSFSSRCLLDILRSVQKRRRDHWLVHFLKSSARQEEINRFKATIMEQRASLLVSFSKPCDSKSYAYSCVQLAAVVGTRFLLEDVHRFITMSQSNTENDVNSCCGIIMTLLWWLAYLVYHGEARPAVSDAASKCHNYNSGVITHNYTITTAFQSPRSRWCRCGWRFHGNHLRSLPWRTHNCSNI